MARAHRSRRPPTLGKRCSVSSQAEAAQRSTMSGRRQRVTLPVRRATPPWAFSIALLVARCLYSDDGSLSRCKVQRRRLHSSSASRGSTDSAPVPLWEGDSGSALLFAAGPPELHAIPVDQRDAIFPDHRDGFALHRWDRTGNVASKGPQSGDLPLGVNRPLLSERLVLRHVRELTTAKATAQQEQQNNDPFPAQMRTPVPPLLDRTVSA